MATLEVKLQLNVEQITYNQSSPPSSALNFRFVHQFADGIPVEVAPVFTVLSQTTTATKTAVSTTTTLGAGPSQFGIALEAFPPAFQFLNSKPIGGGQTDFLGNAIYVIVSGLVVDAFVVGDPGRTLSEATNVNVPTQTVTDTLVGGVVETIILPNYEWVSVNVPSPPLFTISDNVVDFNALLPAQRQSLFFSNLYHTLDGNDRVTLPTAINALSLGGTGVKFDSKNPLVLGNGTDTVFASDAPTNLTLGTGIDTLNYDSSSAVVNFGGGGGTLFLNPTSSSSNANITVNLDALNDTVNYTAGVGGNLLLSELGSGVLAPNFSNFATININNDGNQSRVEVQGRFASGGGGDNIFWCRKEYAYT